MKTLVAILILGGCAWGYYEKVYKPAHEAEMKKARIEASRQAYMANLQAVADERSQRAGRAEDLRTKLMNNPEPKFEPTPMTATHSRQEYAPAPSSTPKIHGTTHRKPKGF